MDRGLVGCSPWGCKELDMTEQLHLIYLYKYVFLYVRLLLSLFILLFCFVLIKICAGTLFVCDAINIPFVF